MPGKPRVPYSYTSGEPGRSGGRVFSPGERVIVHTGRVRPGWNFVEATVLDGYRLGAGGRNVYEIEADDGRKAWMLASYMASLDNVSEYQLVRMARRASMLPPKGKRPSEPPRWLKRELKGAREGVRRRDVFPPMTEEEEKEYWERRRERSLLGRLHARGADLSVDPSEIRSSVDDRVEEWEDETRRQWGDYRFTQKLARDYTGKIGRWKRSGGEQPGVVGALYTGAPTEDIEYYWPGEEEEEEE